MNRVCHCAHRPCSHDTIKVIEQLLALGVAYVSEGCVFLDSEAWMAKNGTTLMASHILKQLEEVLFCPKNPQWRRNPSDVCLFFRMPQGTNFVFDSPWGEGRFGCDMTEIWLWLQRQ